MDTLTRSASVRGRVKGWRDCAQRIALVPTAGTLHKGHMSLVAEAQECAEHVIVSAFSDPPQFDGRSHGADRDLLANVGAEVLFAPPVQELFPIGREASALVTLPELADVLEGAARPGHFAATLTALTKLFNIIRPDVAVFGERDFQLLVMARRLVEDLFLPIEVVACPTFRDGDGVALATVNKTLTAEQRRIAPQLYATLGEMAQRIDSGERDYDTLQRQGAQKLDRLGFETEYFAIRQAATLAPAKEGVRELVIMAAVHLGDHRLIDSLPIGLIDRF